MILLGVVVELNDYERVQLEQIREWRSEEPSVVSKSIGAVMSPIAWLLGKVVPSSATRAALDVSSRTAAWLTDTNDIVREAGVKALGDLKTHDLKKSDELANSVHNWAIGLASIEGGVTGATGLVGLAVDIPAIVILALRTASKIGACYGFEAQSRSDRDFLLGILSASSANDMKEKLRALVVLHSVEVMLTKNTWESIARTAVHQQMGHEAGIIAVKSLARQLGINLTKRKALQAIPVVGAVVGASVNYCFINDVSWAARRAFQERWLAANGKLRAAAELTRELREGELKV